MNEEAIALIGALTVSRDTKLDLYSQFQEDCEEYSDATAMEKLETAIGDLTDAA
jgi:hypothetical protein